MQLKNHKLIQNAQGSLIQTIFLINIILLISLGSCANSAYVEPRPVVQVETVVKEVAKTPLNLPEPKALPMEDVTWIIVTPDNMEEVFAKLQEKGIEPVIFGLAGKNYENLAVNFSQIRGYMIKQRELIAEYKGYYEADLYENEQ